MERGRGHGRQRGQGRSHECGLMAVQAPHSGRATAPGAGPCLCLTGRPACPSEGSGGSQAAVCRSHAVRRGRLRDAASGRGLEGRGAPTLRAHVPAVSAPGACPQPREGLHGTTDTAEPGGAAGHGCWLPLQPAQSSVGPRGPEPGGAVVSRVPLVSPQPPPSATGHLSCWASPQGQKAAA